MLVRLYSNEYVNLLYLTKIVKNILQRRPQFAFGADIKNRYITFSCSEYNLYKILNGAQNSRYTMLPIAWEPEKGYFERLVVSESQELHGL